MSSGDKIVSLSVRHPKAVTVMVTAFTILLALLAALPSFWPQTFKVLNSLHVDTDPENMLSATEPVRIFHDRMKKKMALYDMVIVGIVNDENPRGVFNPDSLKNIFELTAFAKTLSWPDPDNPGHTMGVIETEILSPSTVDNIEMDNPGTVRFEWKASRIPLFKGTLVSEDGRALCLYLPLSSKDQSYRVYKKLQEKISTFSGSDKFYITGLPVAEDTFGVEMFIQMAVSAPLAMLIIFLVMLFFFKKLVLIISPLLLAMIATICTMALLIITGNTIHIMSSMIPIFIMPIAVLDSVHILSEFFDRYPEIRDRKKTITEVMSHLFMPMLYTSLTTAVGFASLALAPIPPVQVFGIFVAFGVMLAWILTIAFIPAYVMFIPEKSLAGFGRSGHTSSSDKNSLLLRAGSFASRRPIIVMTVVFLLAVIAVFGIFQIEINDNPIKWFEKKHPIRIADHVLNQHFAGTYMAYLSLNPEENDININEFARGLKVRLKASKDDSTAFDPASESIFIKLEDRLEAIEENRQIKPQDMVESLRTYAEDEKKGSAGEQGPAWDEALLFLDRERQRFQIFKQPEMLLYIDRLKKELLQTGVVGKANTLSDIIKTVYRELVSGKQADFAVPQTASAVAQCLITYQNSHRPRDLWHFVTPDYKNSVLWLQLKSGDNRNMTEVIKIVNQFVRDNPPPFPLTHKWFGLTYINVVWQQKMVRGMFNAFMGSFLIVFLMMTILYRSALWGCLSMVPLTVTLAFIYGVIGIMGKDYDMPVAVLSSLSLGLAIDYAIHFLSRTRAVFREKGTWNKCVDPMFGEPARAISRNVLVIGVGFTPLLLAPLTPYQTVGIFIAAILLTAGIASLLILPASISIFEKLLFPRTASLASTCRYATCLLSGAAFVALVVMNVIQFTEIRWATIAWISAASMALFVTGCFVLSRRKTRL